MTDRISLALAQFNPIMGDLSGNITKLRQLRREAGAAGVDLVVTPELAICGYPPEDLVLKPAFVDACMAAVEELAATTEDPGPVLLIGSPWRDGDAVYNAVLLLEDGKVTQRRYKVDLPNYGVFDEKRVFTAGPMPGPIPVRGVRIGVPICEDMWTPDVCECLAESGAELLVAPNGSPWEVHKPDQRIALAVARVTETGLPLVYVNQVGGQDELVFDGASFALSAENELVAQLPAFESALAILIYERTGDGWRLVDAPDPVPPPDPLQAQWQAMVLGLRDYVDKTGFPGVVLGLSGGIDSAVSAAVAVDALGPDRVQCVMMPSRYTSAESLDDAAACAEALGVRYQTIPIAPAVAAFTDMLSSSFGDRGPDLTEENIQSRIRGLTLMALSNKLGPMVLTTGNKSEMAVGYATLYGDMCGGYSVLKDVYKTDVFELARWRNNHRPPDAFGPVGRVMPERVITKPPSAELREDQKDEDSLPPYDVLDGILRGLIEERLDNSALVERGFEAATVSRVRRLLDGAEYKRRQAPPGVKTTPLNFGRDRRVPIVNRYREP